MATTFFSRQEKSTWGIPANQNANGELFVGKGWGTPFASQFSQEETDRVRQCLTKTRGDRYGRFWVNRATETVTMMVGDSADNEIQDAKY
jgi:hypothetical protein